MQTNKNSLANLIPVTKENAAEVGRRGGIKSGQSKRKKKLLKETLAMLMDLPPGLTKQREFMAMMGVKDEELTNQTLIALSMIQEAANGDVKAASFIRDTLGQKPTDKVETTVVSSPLDDKLAELSPEELRALAGLDDD